MSDFIDILKSHPVAVAAAILILALAARMASRLAFYVLMVALIVLVGTFWSAEFMDWMN